MCGSEMTTAHDFIDDAEKVRDFVFLSKEEFLQSYSYLTEEEYDATAKRVMELASKET